MPYQIMVVDDNDMNLVLLSKILELEGYQVRTALNGTEAIRLAKEQMPDLAILDVMMPDMDGYELCRKLRQPPFNQNIPIVMLTAMSGEKDRQEALEAGANDVWNKPFDMDLFKQRIGELIEKK
jgi:two-component system, cell cycle response regulator